MSDTTDMIMEGFLCQICTGVMPDMSPTDKELADAPKDKNGIPIIESKAPGYPRTCPDCGGKKKR